MAEEILRMENITKAYELGEEEFLALRGVDLVVDRGEFLAVLGDNNKETEIVSPLSTMRQAMLEALNANGGYGGGGDIEAHIYLDGKELGASMVKFTRNEKKRTGKNPLLA